MNEQQNIGFYDPLLASDQQQLYCVFEALWKVQVVFVWVFIVPRKPPLAAQGQLTDLRNTIYTHYYIIARRYEVF